MMKSELGSELETTEQPVQLECNNESNLLDFKKMNLVEKVIVDCVENLLPQFCNQGD